MGYLAHSSLIMYPQSTSARSSTPNMKKWEIDCTYYSKNPEYLAMEEIVGGPYGTQTDANEEARRLAHAESMFFDMTSKTHQFDRTQDHEGNFQFGIKANEMLPQYDKIHAVEIAVRLVEKESNC